MKTKTLFDVAVGDYLIIESRHGKDITSVESVTETRFITKSGKTWLKKNGREYGSKRDAWHFEWIRPPKDGEIEAIEAQKKYRIALHSLKEIIEKFSRDRMPSQQLVDELNQATERFKAFAVKDA